MEIRYNLNGDLWNIEGKIEAPVVGNLCDFYFFPYLYFFQCFALCVYVK